ncbi:hypothetical protein M422DRAFT_250164 [Sphaerobolus stellatus SS14]|uniref:Unplaced genomic scaffold SPHSTscaffold_33, whole genome shotgun sequence n=1 Tax=Sphaerobolus stellatus (strain SS14) TaxID=990650 RepID=A0A0C9VU18_SPHS4|nr:hypothetical protein M422DRAFT_250164 [Sphaerobolus stellatus SS14]
MTTCAYTLHQTTTVSNQTSHSPATGVDECAEVPDGNIPGDIPGGNLGASPDNTGLNRLFIVIISEAAYLIWKVH